MINYPTADALAAMGETLQHDVCLWSARLAREYHNPPTHTFTRAEPEPIPEAEKPHRRKHVASPDKPAPASNYRGVMVYRGRAYLSHWYTGGKAKSGRYRPLTEDGERWAAQDRARALGVEYLELRDGTRIPYLWKAFEEMAA